MVTASGAESSTPSHNGHLDTPAAAWHARAPELAEWTRDRIIVWTHRFGGYYSDKTGKTKPVTNPTTVRNAAFSDADLLRHFRARRTDDVIGFHPLTPGDESFGKWAGAEIDCHGEGDDPDRNRRYALALYHRLEDLGFRPLLVTWQTGGYHLWVFFDRKVSARVLHAFGRWLVSDAKGFGYPGEVEFYPKQEHVPADGCGNWLRVPGRHHTRDVFASVYDGSAWVEGDDAIDHILSITGDDPELIPEAAAPVKIEPPSGDEEHSNTVTEPDDLLKVLSALNACPGHDVYKTWVDMGQILHSVDSGTLMLDQWIRWSRRSGKFQDGECAEKWKTFGKREPGIDTATGRPLTLGIGTLFKWAKEAGWTFGPKVKTPDRKVEPAEIWDPDNLDQPGDAWEPGVESPAADNDSTPQPAAAASDGLTPLEADDDPHRLARLYVEEKCRHEAGMMLRFWREEWHRWDGSAYRIVPEKELRAELTKSAKAEMDRINLEDQRGAKGKGGKGKDDKGPPVARKVTGRMIADTAHALASVTVLPSRLEAPAWIAKYGPFNAGEVLVCHNGLVHLPSYVRGGDYFRKPTPRFFSPNALDYDFIPTAPEPTEWLSFLRRLWPSDAQSIETLQEWFGYLLTPDTRQQKILFVVGPKRSGKGTIARIKRGLIGPENVAGPTIASLGTNFGLSPLLGKTAAIISDARLSSRTDAAIVTERLLSISGEDALTIDRKNLPAVTAKLPVRFSLLTNELPRFGDSSGALTGRVILLRLTESFYGREDTTLTDRLLAERPGILLWAIAGWKRLQVRGHFIQPAEGRELLSDLEDLASPVGAFVRDRCRVGPGCRAAVTHLFAEWKRWCESQGRKEAGTEAMFGRDLLAAVPTIRRVQPREDGCRYRAYDGIGLKVGGI
jgi:putative DNA primase/helicase